MGLWKKLFGGSNDAAGSTPRVKGDEQPNPKATPSQSRKSEQLPLQVPAGDFPTCATSGQGGLGSQ
jgi:hypothetical protein